MKLLSQPKASRTAASLMLAVWFFVLGAGFANACLLEAPDHAERQGGQKSSHAISHVTSHAAAPAHDTERSSKAPCLKACDEGSQALQSSNGMGSVDPGPPPLAGVIWTRLAPLNALPGGGIGAEPPLSDPPERIIYMRWTL
ncbi:MAG: hypothetical protein V4757_01870 [Pseudomonadota bacterium]